MKVLIADDHAAITMAVSGIAQNRLDISESRIVHNGDDLLRALQPNGLIEEPPLVVMDLRMPGRYKYLALVRQVLQRQPGAKLLIYSTSDAPYLVSSALHAGVMGFVPKTSRLRTLADGMEAVIVGDHYVANCINLASASDHPWTKLTDAERDVMIQLGRGMKLAEIAEVTGRHYKSISTHKYNAMNKLALEASTEMHAYFLQEGLDFLICQDGD